MLIEKKIKLSEEADSHHIAVIEKYKDSSLANLLDQDISELMFGGKAWKQGLSNDELEKISLAIASLECKLENKSKKTYWLGLDQIDETDEAIDSTVQLLVEGARARRNELDQVNSVFVEMWRNL